MFRWKVCITSVAKKIDPPKFNLDLTFRRYNEVSLMMVNELNYFLFLKILNYHVLYRYIIKLKTPYLVKR